MGISQKLEVVLRPWGLTAPQTLFFHPFVFLVEAHILSFTVLFWGSSNTFTPPRISWAYPVAQLYSVM